MPKSNTKCVHCDKEFYVKPYRLKMGRGKYCSVKCKALFEGTKIPTTYPEARECPECEGDFEVIARYKQRKFCSHTCAARFSNKKRQGIKYKQNSPKSTTFRNLLIQQHGHACMICGYDKFVDAHHMIPQSKKGKSTEENGILLCPNHHREADRKLLSIEDLKNYRKLWSVGGNGSQLF